MSGFAAITLCLLIGIPPAPIDKTQRVHDFADELPADVEKSLETLAQNLERDTTVQFAIVTVKQLDGKEIAVYAKELFNKWGIGRADVNNGILLLHAPKERLVRIHVGLGLEPFITDSVYGDILDEAVIPHFKKDEFAEGIKAGAERIDKLIREHPEAAKGDKGSIPMWIRSKRTDAMQSIWASGLLAIPVIGLGWYAKKQRSYSKLAYLVIWCVILAAVGIALYLIFRAPNPGGLLKWFGGSGAVLGGATLFNVSRYRRYRPHACPHCGSRQELLDEMSDDAKLTEVQKLEEKLGAVDYDVWYCPACLKSDVVKYISSYDFTDCPKCKAHTMRLIDQRTLIPATTLSTGMMQYTRKCASCQNQTVEQQVIPRISTSTSSGGGGFSSSGGGGGGSSFGGGSSGGGGASRSY
jgi:uncharacterized protein